MDTCFDSRDDKVFIEIERQLLRLISEDEEEAEAAAIISSPFQTSGPKEARPLGALFPIKLQCCDSYPSRPLKQQHKQTSVLRLKSSRPTTGTGVFIPRAVHAAASVRPRANKKLFQQNQAQGKVIDNPKGAWCLKPAMCFTNRYVFDVWRIVTIVIIAHCRSCRGWLRDSGFPCKVICRRVIDCF